MARQESLFADDEAQPYNGGPPTSRSSSTKITLKVEVLAPPEYGVGKTGTEYCRLAVRDVDTARGRGTFAVICFKEACNAARALSVGDKVTVSGREDDRDARNLVAYGVHLPGQRQEKLSPRARVIREYGSIQAFRDSVKKDREYHLAAGRVQVTKRGGGLEWISRADCVEHEGVWKKRIDALCDEYGDAVISQELRDLLSGSPSLKVKTNKDTGFSRASGAWVSRYRRWLDERVRVMLGQPKEDLFE